MDEVESMREHVMALEDRVSVLETAMRHVLRSIDLRDNLLIPRFMAEAHADADALEAEASATANAIIRAEMMQRVRFMRRVISLLVD